MNLKLKYEIICEQNEKRRKNNTYKYVEKKLKN